MFLFIFLGFVIGGLGLGETPEQRASILDAVLVFIKCIRYLINVQPSLPLEAPRVVHGIGIPGYFFPLR